MSGDCVGSSQPVLGAWHLESCPADSGHRHAPGPAQAAGERLAVIKADLEFLEVESDSQGRRLSAVLAASRTDGRIQGLSPPFRPKAFNPK